MRGQKWLEDQDDFIIRLYESGVAVKEIARRLPLETSAKPRHIAAVRTRLGNLGMARGQSRVWTDEVSALAIAGWRAHWPVEQIARAVSALAEKQISEETLRRQLQKLRAGPRPKVLVPFDEAAMVPSGSEDYDPSPEPVVIPSFVMGDRLVDWLRCEGHQVRRNPRQQDPLGGWLLNGRAMTWGQLVLNGNRLRIAAGMPSIHVPDVAA